MHCAFTSAVVNPGLGYVSNCEEMERKSEDVEEGKKRVEERTGENRKEETKRGEAVRGGARGGRKG